VRAVLTGVWVVVAGWLATAGVASGAVRANTRSQETIRTDAVFIVLTSTA
jgi:hypothetical protein